VKNAVHGGGRKARREQGTQDTSSEPFFAEQFFHQQRKDYEHVTRVSSRNTNAVFAKRKESGIFVSV
jgi:hypothetical protein